MAKAAEQEKSDFVQKNLKFSGAHRSWAQSMETMKGWADKKYWKIFTYMFVKPEISVEPLKKVKKVAILSFDVRVDAKQQKRTSTSDAGYVTVETTHYGAIDMSALQPFANTMYDEMKAGLERQGIAVISDELVKNNTDYQALDYKEVEEVELKQGAADWWNGTTEAYGLKQIDAAKMTGLYWEREERKIYGDARVDKAKASGGLKGAMRSISGADKQVERGKHLQNAARALGVDAVILVKNNIGMNFGVSKTYKLHYGFRDGGSGVAVDMLFADEIKPIWSAEIVKKIEVPTKVKSPKGGIFKPQDYDLGLVAPDLVLVYHDIADLISLKIKLDQQRPAPVAK
ncbi:MAG: hypothetical protein NTX59_09305 [Elusimicrobia bacterium]|nr:hypothetical protein [Elusimicrobiota bacterium]